MREATLLRGGDSTSISWLEFRATLVVSLSLSHFKSRSAPPPQLLFGECFVPSTLTGFGRLQLRDAGMPLLELKGTVSKISLAAVFISLALRALSIRSKIPLWNFENLIHVSNGTVNPEIFRLVTPARLDRTVPLSSDGNFQKFTTEGYWKPKFFEWNSSFRSEWSNRKKRSTSKGVLLFRKFSG